MKTTDFNEMNKEQLTELVMSKTHTYKKTNLIKMHKADLIEVAKLHLVEDGESESAMEPETETIKEVAEIPAEPQVDEAAGPRERKITDTEKLMLATIPQLPEFKDLSSIIESKIFLAKVSELHSIEIKKASSVMVAMKRKGYIRVIGKKSGEKKTKIQLLDKGLGIIRGYAV